jgi:hypothetical protein
MIRLVYQGVDSLDVAIKGAASDDVLQVLEHGRAEAEADANNDYGIPVSLGPYNRAFVVKAHGKKGGYRYTIVDIATGSIFSIKNDHRPLMWNIFVSTRAHTLLSRGYEGTKSEINACLDAMGVVLREFSVNRIDYALDFVAPEFELDMAKFVAPRRSKVSPYFEAGHHLGDHGDRLVEPDASLPVGSVMRGGRFESVTIAKMPGRQVIVYDKTRAAKEQQTPYWFAAWGLDPDDTANRVWRIEIRAGRDSWKVVKGPFGVRTFDTIEALLQGFLIRALQDIRYVANRADISNVTRAETHPLWRAAQDVVADMPQNPEPPLTPDYMIELMRKQRVAMAMVQGFGNINNLLVLEGLPPKEIEEHYVALTADWAQKYIDEIGIDNLARKLEKTVTRQAPFLQQND